MSPDSDVSPETHHKTWRRLDAAQRRGELGAICAYYGVDMAVFAGHELWLRGGRGALFIASASIKKVSDKPDAIGMRLRRGRKPGIQVANPFARRFLATATAHVVDLDDAQATAWFDRAIVMKDMALAAISHQNSSDTPGTASDLSQARTASRCHRIEHPVNRLEGARAESAADPKREPNGGEKWRLDAGYYLARWRGRILGRVRVHQGIVASEISKGDACAVALSDV